MGSGSGLILELGGLLDLRYRKKALKKSPLTKNIFSTRMEIYFFEARNASLIHIAQILCEEYPENDNLKKIRKLIMQFIYWLFGYFFISQILS